MKPRACIVVYCQRTTRDVICGRCWRFVSVPTKLALEDQGKLWTAARACHDELAEFLSWSYWSTMRLAAAESREEQDARERERYLAEWQRDIDAMSARQRRGTRRKP